MEISLDGTRGSGKNPVRSAPAAMEGLVVSQPTVKAVTFRVKLTFEVVPFEVKVPASFSVVTIW
jgi:hypothetical protein